MRSYSPHLLLNNVKEAMQKNEEKERGEIEKDIFLLQEGKDEENAMKK